MPVGLVAGKAHSLKLILLTGVKPIAALFQPDLDRVCCQRRSEHKRFMASLHPK